jgi:hypothetical protein
MFTQDHPCISTIPERIAPAPRLELNRMLATAVVDCQFRDQLLTNPALLIDEKYLGKNFLLAEDERASLLSIQAHSLQDLAEKLLFSLNCSPISIRQISYVDYE